MEGPYTQEEDSLVASNPVTPPQKLFCSPDCRRLKKNNVDVKVAENAAGEKTARNRTRGSLGEVAEVGERAAVDSVVCVCRIKAPQ